MTRVGVIGLGNMGSALTHNLVRAGVSLVVHDIRPEAGKPFIEKGAEWADSPAQLINDCLLYTSPSPRDRTRSRMPSSA